MAALLPFRKAADFLGELLSLSGQSTASTVRNRTMKVGKRLGKSVEALATPASKDPSKELIVGFDGGYVRNRHQRPERNSEVIAGKALDSDGHAIRFAFVRNRGSDGVSAIGLALQHCGANEATSVTVLTDGAHSEMQSSEWCSKGSIRVTIRTMPIYASRLTQPVTAK